jgi:hypothetical protein
MALAEPPGDFDYLLKVVDETHGDIGPDDDDFDLDPYQPPPPWYRTTAAMVTIGAMGVAVVAILVSAVLLVSRHSRGTTNNVETPIATTPSSAPATTPPKAATVPPSPPESPSPSASTVSPPVVAEPPSQSQPPEPTRPPQIGVTRVPVTRQPISVRPVPRQAFPGY